MATDNYGTDTQQKKSGGSGCLMGCLIAFGVLLLIAVLAVWWVSRNWRGLAGSFAAETINQMVDQSNLPAAEKEELKAEAKRLTDGISDGSISTDQLEQIMAGLSKSPLVPMFMVKAVEAQYLDGSGLSDEEKAAGRVTLERYARALVDEDLDQQSIDNVMVHIADKDAGGNWQLREQVSDDELRAFLAAAKQEADQAGIPEEVPPIDPSDELKKIIDAALGEEGEAPPAAE